VATEEAARYCQEHGKKLKIVSTKEHKGTYLVGDFPSVTLVFKMLSEAEAEAAVAAPNVVSNAAPNAAPDAVSGALSDSGDFHAILIKLDDLRKKGIVTEEEFQAAKTKLLSKIVQ
jgi:hypothetical protein